MEKIMVRSFCRKVFCSTILVGVILILGCWFGSAELITYFKPKIERLLSEKIGYTVSFESGAVKLYPFLGITLKEMTAQSTQGCAPWSAAEMSFKLEIVPLIKRQFDVRRVDIEGIDGTIGWVDGQLVQSDATGARCMPQTAVQEAPAPAPATVTNPAKSRRELPVSITLEEFQITGAALRIHGAEKTHELRIERAQASLQINRGGIDVPMVQLSGTFDSFPAKIAVADLKCSAGLTAFSLGSGSLQLGQERILIRGNYDSAASTGQATLDLKEFSLAELRRIFGARLPVTGGSVTSQVNASVSGDRISVLGDAYLRNFHSVPADLSLKELAVTKLAVELEKFALHSLTAHIRLDQFAAKDDGDAYSVDSVEGPLSLSMKNDIQFGGDLQIQNFGFADDETRIQKVVAALHAISGSVSKKGDVTVSVNLDAHGVELHNPSIEVNAVERVTAPLVVRIPAGAGYSVSGPVQITDATLTLADRKLQKVTATVAMSVAGALKDFHTTNLLAESYNQSLKTSAHFSMTGDEYRIRDTVIQIGDGSIAAEFSMGRRAPKPIDLNIRIKALPIPATWHAVMQKEEVPLRGTATSVSMRVTGNRSEMPASLSGSGDVRIDDFVFHTVDIEGLIRNAIADIPFVGTDLVASDSPQSLDGGDLGSSIVIGDSQVRAPDLKVQLSNMTVEGNVVLGFDSSLKGDVSIVFLEQIFRLLGFGFETLGNFFAREGRIAIPFLISGEVSSPSIRPDVKEIAETVTGLNLLRSVAGGVEDAVEDVAEDAEEVGEEVVDAL